MILTRNKIQMFKFRFYASVVTIIETVLGLVPVRLTYSYSKNDSNCSDSF
jgi:hypothetical protein